MFNIYSYGEKLARTLKAIGHTDNQCRFYEATDQTELHELEQNISSAQGTILIAIDGQMSGFSFDADSLIEKPVHSIVIAKQTQSTNAKTITLAQKECKAIMDQVVAKILNDAFIHNDECDKVDVNTMTIEGFGPIAGVFYGVMLTFTLAEGKEYIIKKDMWNEI